MIISLFSLSACGDKPQVATVDIQAVTQQEKLQSIPIKEIEKIPKLQSFKLPTYPDEQGDPVVRIYHLASAEGKLTMVDNCLMLVFKSRKTLLVFPEGLAKFNKKTGALTFHEKLVSLGDYIGFGGHSASLAGNADSYARTDFTSFDPKCDATNLWFVGTLSAKK